MKREKMQLTLVPSLQMDKWAKSNKNEHRKVRLSRRARVHYGPSDWEKIYLKIYGSASEDRLRIGQATKADIKEQGPKKAKRTGFVTTETYERLMGEQNNNDIKSIWVSENMERVTIGADPEFVLTRTDGTAVYGDTAFDDKWAKLGSDGPCAELRPDPSPDTEGLITNIKTLLTGLSAKRIEQYKWVGGATYRHPNMQRRYSIGGHIHFGLPNIPGAAKQPNHILQKRVGRVLDELVAVPLVRIDTPLPEERRGALRYGRFEDLRTYNYKFEWRVLSGLWLVHTELTNAVLNTAKAVVEESWKRYIDRDHDEDFMLNTDNNDNLITSFDCISTEKIRNIVNVSRASTVSTELVHTIHGKLKKMSTYCLYKEAIDDFIKICCSKDMPLTNDKLELRRSWVEGKPL